MQVTPKVEVLKGETAKLPCTYTVTPSSSNTVVEWFIVSNFSLYIFFIQISFGSETYFLGSESLTSQS